MLPKVITDWAHELFMNMFVVGQQYYYIDYKKTKHLATRTGPTEHEIMVHDSIFHSL